MQVSSYQKAAQLKPDLTVAVSFDRRQVLVERRSKSGAPGQPLPIEDEELEAVVGSTAMRLLPWLEEEAILSLPLVPRHPDCALLLGENLPPTESDRANPFAALARLKRGDGSGGSG